MNTQISKETESNVDISKEEDKNIFDAMTQEELSILEKSMESINRELSLHHSKNLLEQLRRGQSSRIAIFGEEIKYA